MKVGKWARLLLAAAPLVAGCGNFWQAPSSSSGTCTTNCTTATSSDFYILNGGTTPEIVGESIVTGTLTAISGSPWTVNATPYSMAIAPNGNFLCVSTASGVFAYTNSTGKLGTATLVSSDMAYAIQVNSTDSWLLEAIQVTGGVQVSAIPIKSATGAYTGGNVLSASFSVTNAALQPNKMVISPDNSNLFIALGAGGTIVVPFSSTSPFPSGVSATSIPVANSGGAALSVAVDPLKTPRLFYIGESDVFPSSTSNSGGLRAFNYSSLPSLPSQSELTSSPIASGGLAPSSILPIASGDYVYVANGNGTSAGNITGFAVSSSSPYSLTTGSTAALGILPSGLAQDSTNVFLLAVSSSGSPYFSPFTFDSTTAGELDAQNTANTGASPIAIVAAP